MEEPSTACGDSASGRAAGQGAFCGKLGFGQSLYQDSGFQRV